MNDIFSIHDGRVVALVGSSEGDRHIPRDPCPKFGWQGRRTAAAWFSAADLTEGVRGGVGLVRLAAAAHGFEVTREYGIPSDEIEAQSESSLIDMIEGAATRTFRILLVSQPVSLGRDMSEAWRVFRLLIDCGVSVYAGRDGLLTPDDFNVREPT